MTALGIFLLSSLFFVLMGMAEFAVLLFLLRRSEPKLENLKKSNSSNDGHNVDNMFEYVDDRRIVTTGHAKTLTCHVNRQSLSYIQIRSILLLQYCFQFCTVYSMSFTGVTI